MYSFDEVLNYDPEVAKAMEDELTRQRTHIELIASENLVSKALWQLWEARLRINIRGLSGKTLLWRMRICGCC